MKISILTLFPEVFAPYLGSSIAARAIESGRLSVETVNIREYSTDKHRRVDDYPFGGGAGMVMGPQSLFDAIRDVKKRNPAKVVYLSPCGKTLDNHIARSYADEDGLILLCGHYEGVDQRVLDELVDEEISIGDYVLTGGELPAMVLVDAMMRFIPGVVGSENVHEEESFEDGLLEYPQYTRPANFEGHEVPEVLLSGHHANIRKWRRQKQLEITQSRRPDLLNDAKLTKEDQKLLRKIGAKTIE